MSYNSVCYNSSVIIIVDVIIVDVVISWHCSTAYVDVARCYRRSSMVCLLVSRSVCHNCSVDVGKQNRSGFTFYLFPTHRTCACHVCTSLLHAAVQILCNVDDVR